MRKPMERRFRVVVMALVAMIAVPLQAKPVEDSWSASTLAKLVKRFVVKTFGDGLIIPRP